MGSLKSLHDFLRSSIIDDVSRLSSYPNKSLSRDNYIFKFSIKLNIYVNKDFDKNSPIL